MKSFDNWLNEYAPAVTQNTTAPLQLWNSLRQTKDMSQVANNIYKLKVHLATLLPQVDAEAQERVRQFMPAFTKEYYQGMYPERWRTWTDEFNYILSKAKK